MVNIVILKILWSILILSLLLIGSIFIPGLYYPEVQGFLFIILGVISWGISIGLFDILIFRRGDTIKINLKRVGVYFLIGLVLNYILLAYYVIYIPVSLLMFLTMAIYGGIKLFRKA